MKRCPNVYLEEVWPLVRWYTDWDMFKALPYGGTDVLDQPHFVVQILRRCIETNLEIDEKIRKEFEKKCQR